MDDNVVGLVAVIGLFVIPSLGLVGHLVLRPMLDTYLKAKGLSQPAAPVDQARLGHIEEQLSQMQERMDRLTEAVEFDAQLRAGAGTTAPRLPQGQPEA